MNGGVCGNIWVMQFLYTLTDVTSFRSISVHVIEKRQHRTIKFKTENVYRNNNAKQYRNENYKKKFLKTFLKLDETWKKFFECLSFHSLLYSNCTVLSNVISVTFQYESRQLDDTYLVYCKSNVGSFFHFDEDDRDDQIS